MKKIMMTLLGAGLIFTSCEKNDDNGGGNGNDGPRNFKVTIENVTTPSAYFSSGLAAVPVDSATPGPIFPGGKYEFKFNAGPRVLPPPTGDMGTRLSFATMMVQSNDLFYAPDGQGIALYDGSGNPITGDVTSQIKLWDAGTEVDEETGSPNQKPQQTPMEEDKGVDENGVVTEIMGNMDDFGNVLPAVADVIKVTLANSGTEFTVTIENVSDGMTIATPALGMGTTAAVPMSPTVWVVHTAPNPLFEVGTPASEGIENIAEDGFAMVENERLMDNTGLIVPLSPGAWAVHSPDVHPFYESGEEDFGEGLEAIAEDGDASEMAASLEGKSGVSASGMFNMPVGASMPGAIGPGGRFEFEFTAENGDRLSLATMFVQSNDWIYAFGEDGIELFPNGDAANGQLTSSLGLYDVGTEADEFLGAGLNQVIRQSGPNTGPADGNTSVRVVSNTDMDNIPANGDVIRVTIEAL